MRRLGKVNDFITAFNPVLKNCFLVIMLHSITLTHIACEQNTTMPIQTIKIAAIISNNDSYMFCLRRVRPAIEIAIDKVRQLQILPDWVHLVVNYSDSHCNPKDAPVAAFNYYMERSVDVFLGPVCDYALAPVARYAPFWNLPVISPGGFAHDFGFNKTDPAIDPEFSTLIRVGNTFNSLATSTLNMIMSRGWRKMLLLYNGEGHSEVTPRFCYLCGSSLIYYIKEYEKMNKPTLGEYEFYLYSDVTETKRILAEKVGTRFAGN